nr:MATE family efflux transporter [Lachnospiraceae bacterium]
LPVVCNELMWGAGFSTIAAILGHTGSPVVAANSVAHVVRNLATVVSFGVANAAGVMIGTAIGENKMEQARMYGNEILKLCTGTGILGALVVLAVRPILMATMTISKESSQYLSMMMFVMAYMVFFQSINATLVVGVFRAGGDTRFGLIIDSLFMWGTSIGVGFLAAFVLKLDVTLVYIILMSDEVLKIPFCLWRFRTYKWINNVTR